MSKTTDEDIFRLRRELAQLLPIYIESIKSLAHQMAKSNRQGNFDDKTLTRVVTRVTRLISLHSQIRAFNSKDRLNISVNNEGLLELKARLLHIVKAIRESYYRGDFSLLSDLIEHELIDTLTLWKIRMSQALNQSLQSENAKL